MADDFRISELVTLAPGFAWAALRAAARGQPLLTKSFPVQLYFNKIYLLVSLTM